MEVADLLTPWIAEDDLLLKTAIENGASLEALAKGAVAFSRRFTLKEIQDRWHSILYDPRESTRASFGMSEVENLNVGHASKLLKIPGIKDSEEKSSKRKTESIRRKYYAMRKRIRGQHFSINDLDFSNQDFYNYHLPGNQLADNGNYFLEDHITTNNTLLDPEHETMTISDPTGATDKFKADTLYTKMLSSSDLICSDAGHLCLEYGEQQLCFNSPIPDGLDQMHPFGLSSPTTAEPLWKMTEDVSAPLLPVSVDLQDETHDPENKLNHPNKDHDCLNSTNDGGLIFMDPDVSASVDKSCYDNSSFLLISSPIYAHAKLGQHDCVSVSVTKDAGPFLATSVVASSTNLDITTNPLKSEKSNLNDTCLDAIIPSPSLVTKTHGLDNKDLEMPCLLNAEIEEVPNNDDLFPVEVAVAMQSLSQNINEKMPMVLDTKADIPYQSVNVLGATPNTSLNNDTKSSIQGRFLDAAVDGKKFYKNNQMVPHNGKAIKGSPSGVTGDIGHAVFMKPDTKAGQLVLPEQISGPKHADEEEPESDDDVPYFSDVEAMVLEMDLCTDDLDPFTCSRVSLYQDEDAQRQIVRLEQCARSYMDRRLELHGAFAILYGRRLKHYIKKPEVILGRATEEIEVDVDLATEGRANKVSRQQASIRLEADGSFTVTNLGKFKISVNGIDLESGQYMTLHLSNLIEVRGMSFVFEASHKLVQRFLASIRDHLKS